jgi:hypothetical protein
LLVDWEQVEPLTVHDCDVPTQPRLAEQDAVLPPLLPEHVQLNGPEPLTSDALPTLHRADVDGALYTLLPFAEPHTALTAVTQVPPEPLHEPWLQLKVRPPVVGRPLSVNG